MTKTKTTRIQALALIATIPLGLLLSGLLDPHFTEEASHVVVEYLLPIFFIAVGHELRTEFTNGYFKVRRNVLAPLIAAICGVVVPAFVFTLVAGGSNGSWSIPTATDITLGIAVLSFVAADVSSILRARFLALATIDDVIGLLILLLVFSGQISLLAALLTAAALVSFHFVQQLQSNWRLTAYLFAGLAIVVGVESGIQTSLIGVLLGLLISQEKMFNWLESANGWLILPVFGFLVSAMAATSFAAGLSVAVVTAILLRPLGKLLGISVGGALSSKIFTGHWDLRSWASIGLLGGIGFTVSFLLAQLAFKGEESLYASAVVGTLGATFISTVLFFGLVALRGPRVRRAERSL